MEKRTFVSAGKLLEVVCQTVGGHPPPKITWWLGSKRLKHEDEVRCLLLWMDGMPGQPRFDYMRQSYKAYTIVNY